MTELLYGLPKVLLKRCHHLIHHLTCMLYFVLTNIRYQTLLNGAAHICHYQRHSTYNEYCDNATSVVGAARLCHIHCHTVCQVMSNYA